MTSDNIAINSTNFKVDKNGNMQAQNGRFTGGQITLSGDASDYNDATFKINGNSTKGYMSSQALEMYTNGLDQGVALAVDGIQGGNQIYVYSYEGETGIGFGDIWTTGTVQAEDFVRTSLAEKKKDFEEFNNALDIIKDTDIYKYQYKNKDNNLKKDIGLVIGEGFNYSEELTNDDNTAVNLSNVVFVCMQAIKEQQQEIDELKKEIQELKGEK